MFNGLAWVKSVCWIKRYSTLLIIYLFNGGCRLGQKHLRRFRPWCLEVTKHLLGIVSSNLLGSHYACLEYNICSRWCKSTWKSCAIKLATVLSGGDCGH